MATLPDIQTITLGSASADGTGYTIVKCLPKDAVNGSGHLGHQILKVECDLNAAGDATIAFLLTDGTTVFDIEEVTCTSIVSAGTLIAKKTAIADGSGNVLCKCVGNSSGTKFVDLAGAFGVPGDGNARWWVAGVIHYTTSASGALRLFPMRAF